MLKNYKKLTSGVIKQETIVDKIQDYDIKYVDDRYNSYGEKGMQMAFLRLGTLIGNIGKIPKSILDIGYGNGDFLTACKTIIPDCNGNDISNYPVPDGCEFIEDIHSKHFDVICFFDALEHFKSIDFVKNLNCDYIYISLPWCHYISDDWFKSWKHRRQDEHLWHFDNTSLVNFFNDNGYESMLITNIEDSIRTPAGSMQNILTGIFKKIK